MTWIRDDASRFFQPQSPQNNQTKLIAPSVYTSCHPPVYCSLQFSVGETEGEVLICLTKRGIKKGMVLYEHCLSPDAPPLSSSLVHTVLLHYPAGPHHSLPRIEPFLQKGEIHIPQLPPKDSGE